jgi:hypothetical protein
MTGGTSSSFCALGGRGGGRCIDIFRIWTLNSENSWQAETAFCVLM